MLFRSQRTTHHPVRKNIPSPTQPQVKTSLTFFGAYTLLEASLNLWLGWTWDVFSHRMMSGSLLLFTLFMITDPRSIPNAKSARIIWAIAIAGLAFILRNYFYLNEAIFVALFALSPLTILLDWLWLAPQFTWQLSKSSRVIDDPNVSILSPESD